MYMTKKTAFLTLFHQANSKANWNNALH